MIYVSSSCIRNNNIAEIICSLSEKGIRNIELSGGTEYYEGIEDDLKILKQRYQLQYACHAYFPPPKVPFVVNLASCNDDIYKKSIEHYDNCIKLLKKINSDVLSIHAGFLVEIDKDEIGRKLSKPTVYDEDEAYDRFCYAYEELSGKCKKHNIKLYLENNVLSQENYKEFKEHNYFMMTDCQSIMYMKKLIDFKLLLDLGHLYVTSNTLGLDYGQECMCLKKYAEWIHISENSGIYDEHKTLKADSTILKEFCKMYNFNMDVTLETVGKMDDILESIKMIKSAYPGTHE